MIKNKTVTPKDACKEGKFIKENSPVWKGGVTRGRTERSTYEYNSWRKAVFERDGYSCQKCHSKNSINNTVVLNAHHIKNWKNNIADRYNVNNGITLCSKCHNEFHKIYSKRNNTEKQIIEFLNQN